MWQSFALGSRIKARAAFNSRLAGIRVLVKDNIDLKGLHTSVGSQAFCDTYGARDETARSIQSILNKGAMVAGKTKMNPFANWIEPIEYVDFQAPWNARGDGYQSPGGSSSGSAAAVAAYEWLDIAIGTDSKPVASFFFHFVPWIRANVCFQSMGKFYKTSSMVWMFWTTPKHGSTILPRS